MIKRVAQLALILTALGQPTDRGLAQTHHHTSPWYRKSRVLDLTGAGPRDSVVVSAIGTQPDSLHITLRLFVAGKEAYAVGWDSDYELIDVDSLDRRPPRLAMFIRHSLDDVLARVKREPIDWDMVRMRVDSTTLNQFNARPTHQVRIRYGYESTVVLGWDSRSGRFLTLWNCC